MVKNLPNIMMLYHWLPGASDKKTMDIIMCGPRDPETWALAKGNKGMHRLHSTLLLPPGCWTMQTREAGHIILRSSHVQTSSSQAKATSLSLFIVSNAQKLHLGLAIGHHSWSRLRCLGRSHYTRCWSEHPRSVTPFDTYNFAKGIWLNKWGLTKSPFPKEFTTHKSSCKRWHAKPQQDPLPVSAPQKSRVKLYIRPW